MVLYVKYFIMQLKSQMQYKTSFFLAIIGQFLTAFTSFWGISFIFNNVSSVDQFTYEEVLLCFAVVMMSFSIGEMFGGGLSVFPRLMHNGSFDRILTRPRSIIFQVLAGNTDFARIGLIVQALVVLIYAVNKSQNSWTFLKICTLILMIGCGSIVFFCLFLITASCTFFTTQSLDFLNVFTYGARQFGRYPFSIYGKGILRFLTFVIPLALFQYYPLLYITDRNKSSYLVIFPVLSLLFILPAYGFFRMGLMRYQSMGS